jgi:hypothetical protein
MQTLRAALYHVRDHHEAFLKPNLKFGITKEEATKREASEAEGGRPCRYATRGLPRHLRVCAFERHPRNRSLHAGTQQS